MLLMTVLVTTVVCYTVSDSVYDDDDDDDDIGNIQIPPQHTGARLADNTKNTRPFIGPLNKEHTEVKEKQRHVLPPFGVPPQYHVYHYPHIIYHHVPPILSHSHHVHHNHLFY